MMPVPTPSATSNDERVNIATVAGAPGLHDAVVIAFARREQGILAAPGNPLDLSDIASVARAGARMAQRPLGAGAQLLLLTLLARAGLAAHDLSLLKPVCPTGNDIAQAVRSGRADCGIATRSVALAAALEFLPLTWENFDLVLLCEEFSPEQYWQFKKLVEDGHYPLLQEFTRVGGHSVFLYGRPR